MDAITAIPGIVGAAAGSFGNNVLGMILLIGGGVLAWRHRAIVAPVLAGFKAVVTTVWNAVSGVFKK